MVNEHGIEIVQATPADVKLLLAMIIELAEYERLAHEVVTTEDSLRDALFGDGCQAEALIARLDGAPVGFALFFHNFSTFLSRYGVYIEDIFVRPDFRGRGCGGALFQRVARIARERHCGRVEWSVLNWNEPAIRFYRSLGAEALDGWTTYRLGGEGIQRLPTGTVRSDVISRRRRGATQSPSDVATCRRR